MLGPSKPSAAFAVRNITTIAFIAVMLQGCVITPEELRPVAPPNAVKSANALAVSLRPQAKPDPANFDELKEVVRLLRSDIVAAAEQKNSQSWNNGLATLVGGTMATIGSVGKRTGLTNSGILLALLGLSSDQFYKPANTINVHLDADSKLLCIEDATFDLSEVDRVLATDTEFPGSEEAGKAVATLNGAINGVMLTYRRSLLGIRPGSPTREEIIGFMKRFAADEAANDAGTKEIPPAEQAKQVAAAKKFIGLTTSLQACVKLGVSSAK